MYIYKLFSRYYIYLRGGFFYFMKSICIKTNNELLIDYLLKSFKKIDIDNVYISLCKFKHFTNFIVHNKNDDIIRFISFVSNVITKSIISFYEKDIIVENINLNYFYFNKLERKKILDITLALLSEDNKKYDYINNEVFSYLQNNHSFYFQGFINFKLFNYIKLVNEKIDIAVNKYLIDKEYIEFVNILRLYLKSEENNSQIEHIHLIYKNKTSILIDDNHNIIESNENITKAKYISDISFSSNDLALNTLLNLVPKKITIHLIDKHQDEFINTLKLIFQDRIKICDDCSLCNIYQIRQLKK